MRRCKKWVLFILLSVPFFCDVANAGGEVTVAVASNLRYAMEEIAKVFTSETGIKVSIIPGSSGKIAAQIEAGAPYDVFLSADIGYPRQLQEHGFATDTPRVYARGTLILWVAEGADLKNGMEVLCHKSVSSVAIANPDHAPYGEVAVAAMKKRGIFDSVKGKLVYGESVSQVNQFIASGAVQAAFTAKSAFLTAGLAARGHWMEVDAGANGTIPQGVVLLKHGAERNPGPSKRLMEFLFSEKAGSLLQKQGYGTP